MKELVKTIVAGGIRLALSVFRVFPIKQNRIFFSAYSGNQYACSPKYISEALEQQYPGKFEKIWCYGSDAFATDDKSIRLVRFQSLAYFRLLLTAKVVVLNDLQHCSYLPFRKSQMVIQTWHGCGLYKKVGRDVPNNTSWNDRRLDWTVRSISLFLSGAKQFSQTVVRGAFGYTGDILEAGLPRNDLLLDSHRSAVANQAVRDALGTSPDTKLILYAPTFRKCGEAAAAFPDVEAVLAACHDRFGGDFKMLVRSHYLLAQSPTTGNDCLDVSLYPDMQELLCAADVLISDYSSCIWDFSLSGKPCFLFAPDLSAYRMDRDFYMDVFEWPFPLAQDNSELVNCIIHFDEAAYAACLTRHFDELGCSESGSAATQVAKLIANKCLA